MIEVAAAVSMATSAYKAIKTAVETGREVEDMHSFFARFFDAKEQLSEAAVESQNPSMVGSIFAGSSVEAQALEVTSARYKVAAIEKQLREYLIYSGQADFYDDMMKERRVIRQQRIAAAEARARKRAFWIDVGAVIFGMVSVTVILVGFLAIVR